MGTSVINSLMSSPSVIKSTFKILRKYSLFKRFAEFKLTQIVAFTASMFVEYIFLLNDICNGLQFLCIHITKYIMRGLWIHVNYDKLKLIQFSTAERKTPLVTFFCIRTNISSISRCISLFKWIIHLLFKMYKNNLIFC